MKIFANIADVMHRLSPRCREAARVISREADERPPLLDRVGLCIHVLICTPCRRYRRSVQYLSAKMKQVIELPPPEAKDQMPADARMRIHAALPK